MGFDLRETCLAKKSKPMHFIYYDPLDSNCWELFHLKGTDSSIEGGIYIDFLAVMRKGDKTSLSLFSYFRKGEKSMHCNNDA